MPLVIVSSLLNRLTQQHFSLSIYPAHSPPYSAQTDQPPESQRPCRHLHQRHRARHLVDRYLAEPNLHSESDYLFNIAALHSGSLSGKVCRPHYLYVGFLITMTWKNGCWKTVREKRHSCGLIFEIVDSTPTPTPPQLLTGKPKIQHQATN